MVPSEIRGQLLSELNKWVEQSRSHKANYGFDTPDGKARFDLEKGHSVQQPRLHRVANPCRISEAFQGVLFEDVLPEMDESNGCLRMVPGSQKERHSHFKDGRFIGSTDPSLFKEYDSRAKSLIGLAGDVCLMDIWTMLRGGPNTSTNRPRRVLIADYRAADAFPLTSPAVPSKFYRKIVAGKTTHIARLRAGTMEILEPYEDDSFFGFQGQKTAGENDQS